MLFVSERAAECLPSPAGLQLSDPLAERRHSLRLHLETRQDEDIARSMHQWDGGRDEGREERRVSRVAMLVAIRDGCEVDVNEQARGLVGVGLLPSPARTQPHSPAPLGRHPPTPAPPAPPAPPPRPPETKSAPRAPCHPHHQHHHRPCPGHCICPRRSLHPQTMKRRRWWVSW